MYKDLENKTVFITGTNRGIGRAILFGFAKNKANIIAHTRKETNSFKNLIEELCIKYNIKITPVYFDLKDTKTLKEQCLKIIKENNIDILVNNAGISHGGFFQMTPIQKIKEIFEINLFAQMELTQLILKNMTKNKTGSIINISSVSGIDLLEGNCAYGTSKAALIAFSKVLSKEYAKFNIRTNAIAPALVETDMLNEMEEKAKKEVIESSSFKRLSQPFEIANVTLFLASSQSSFINGQTLRVDGGIY